jgi:translation initiation factor 1 (eIF-1/SUI1)
MNKNSQKTTASTTNTTVTRAAFDRAVADIYRERARFAELEQTTVSRARFDRAIADIKRLRSELAEAYAAGASVVLNSEVVQEYVPTRVRRNLRPGRFGAKARRMRQERSEG